MRTYIDSYTDLISRASNRGCIDDAIIDHNVYPLAFTETNNWFLAEDDMVVQLTPEENDQAIQLLKEIFPTIEELCNEYKL